MQQTATVATCVLLISLAAGCGGSRTVVTTTVRQAVSPVGAPDQRIYGTIKSLRRAGRRYELRFDPAWFTSGVTANVAQARDQGTVCSPSTCPPVANDNYVIDEGHRLLTYFVGADVHGTVLGKDPTGFRSTTITAAQLAKLVAGDSPLRLFEPLSTGVWILVHVDTVRTFAQQYRP